MTPAAFLGRVSAVAAMVASAALAGSPVPGDARRGEQIFRSQQCIQCHSVNGKGGHAAPDLATKVDRDFTPTVMASLMWNHAPDMWAAMRKQDVAKGELTPEAAADLFAYFVSQRYFEKPGDAGRGKQIFAVKRCASCHGLTSSPDPAAPPVAKWESLADPTVLVQQMWNHGAKMREQFAQKKLTWSTLTSQELTDLLVYLQNQPETKSLGANFQLPASEGGEALFQAKGCNGCHTGKLALERLLRNQTLTDIAVDMWNHQPEMKQPPPTFTPEEMRQIIGYIWAKQYFRGYGSVERGKRVFGEKSCATCHNDPASGAPKLGKGKDAYSDITMVASLWSHGPGMLEQMTRKGLPWPRFTAQQMSDLIAWLNAQ
jgi:mono/diheme cytochrome c family protein